MAEEVFFEWRDKTTELIEDNITITPSESEKTTPLEYLMKTVIQLLNEENE